MSMLEMPIEYTSVRGLDGAKPYCSCAAYSGVPISSVSRFYDYVLLPKSLSEDGRKELKQYIAYLLASGKAGQASEQAVQATE